jgi:hypothetical protein
MGDPTPRPAVMQLDPARAESSASMALATPAVVPLQPARAQSSASIELSVAQPQEVTLESVVVRAGARIHVEGEKVTRRRLPRPSWGDLGIAGAAASIAGPVGSLIAGRQAGEVCALIGASVFGIWHYAQRF